MPSQIRAKHRKTQDSQRQLEVIKARAVASLSYPAQVRQEQLAVIAKQGQKRAKSRAVRPTSWTCSSRKSTKTLKSAGARSRPKSRRKTWRPRCRRRWTRGRRGVAEWPKRRMMATIAAQAVTVTMQVICQ